MSDETSEEGQNNVSYLEGFEMELGVGSLIGLVLTVNLLGTNPMSVFEISTYLDPVFLTTWIFSSIIAGTLVGLVMLGLVYLGLFVFFAVSELISG